MAVSSGNHIRNEADQTDADLAGVATRLHSVSIHLLRRVRKVDVATGLSPARLSALSVVVFAGPVTLNELAAAEQVAAPTMSRIVDALEQNGLITRKRDRRDRRALQIRATRKGRRLLERGRARRVAELESLLLRLTRSEQTTVAEATAFLERVLRETG